MIWDTDSASGYPVTGHSDNVTGGEYYTYTSDSTGTDPGSGNLTFRFITGDPASPIPGEFDDLDQDIIDRVLKEAKREQKIRDNKKKIRRRLIL